MTKRKKLIPAVSLIRMSSSQQEASPDQQRAEVKKLEKRYGCRIIREYFDDSVSGDATSKRKDFQRLVSDAEKKRDFQVILCWDQDRFGRFDSIEAGYWIKPLRDAGVRLITFAQGEIDWNDFAGRMMYAIQQEGKHQYLIDLSRNALRGQIAAVMRGAGVRNPAYGYERMLYDEAGKFVRRVPSDERFTKPPQWNSRLAPSENVEEIRTVRWLFQTYATTDCSLRSLAITLNKRGLRTRAGVHWTSRFLKQMLLNPIYVGDRLFGRNGGGKYHGIGSEGQIVSLVGADETCDSCPGIVIKDAHEAIIDRETFEKVQNRFLRYKETNTKPRNSDYLLTGICRCGLCGRRMHGRTHTGSSGGRRHRYYICSGHKNGCCEGFHISADQMEDFVLDYIDKRLKSAETVKAIRKSVQQQAKRQPAADENVRSLKAQIAAVQTKINKGTKNVLLADLENLPELSKVLDQWRGQRSKIEAELESVLGRQNGENPKKKAQHARVELARLQHHLKTGDPLRIGGVIKAMIHELILWCEPHGKRFYRVSRALLVPFDPAYLVNPISGAWPPGPWSGWTTAGRTRSCSSPATRPACCATTRRGWPS